MVVLKIFIDGKIFAFGRGSHIFEGIWEISRSSSFEVFPLKKLHSKSDLAPTHHSSVQELGQPTLKREREPGGEGRRGRSNGVKAKVCNAR